METEFPRWQPDGDTQECLICQDSFTFFNRRHHCRKCGRVVCSDCSKHEIRYLPNTLIVHAYGRPTTCLENRTYRTCDQCAAEVKLIRQTLVASHLTDDSLSRDANANTRLPIDNSFRRGDSPSTNANTKFASQINSRPLNVSLSTLTRTNRTDAESDRNLCPVCAVNLLQLFVSNGQGGETSSLLSQVEAFKEAHINECLVSFDFNNDHMRLQSPPSSSHARNRMLVYNIPPIPKPAFESVGDIPGSLDTIVQNKELCGLFASTHTIEREKDLLDDECVICLEDLKPGDKVGRLECLCVFHYKCIKDWFNKKTYGECPVHFLHK